MSSYEQSHRAEDELDKHLRQVRVTREASRYSLARDSVALHGPLGVSASDEHDDEERNCRERGVASPCGDALDGLLKELAPSVPMWEFSG